MKSIVLGVVVVVCFVVGACTHQGIGRVSEHGRCEAKVLEKVFRNPPEFDGKTFCGSAYYFGDGIRAFYPAPMSGADESRWSIAVLVSPGELQKGSVAFSELATGDLVQISGKLEVDKSCFAPPDGDMVTKCVPFSHPIYIHSLSISLKRRN